LQILDNGRLTDAHGKTVNFKNTIIIMTSNVGSHYFKQMATLGFGHDAKKEIDRQEESFKDRVKESLKGNFKPEFLNRIDELIVFNALRRADIEKIVDIQLSEIKDKLAKRGIVIAIDESARKYVVDNGFDPDFGARPIARLIQKTILDAMADKMIRGQIKDGDKVKIAFSNQKPVITTV
jgi:ATP-dependent Clp protease ATP-binding subunit ClpA